MESEKIASLGRDARANRFIILLLGIGFAALLAAAIGAFWVQRQNEADARLVTHTLAVEAGLGAFASANERMETARRGLLFSGNQAFARIMVQAETTARAELGKLEALVADNPRQRSRIAQLKTSLAAYSGHHAAFGKLTHAERQALVADLMNDPGTLQIRHSRSVIDAMLSEELGLLREREMRQDRTQFLFSITLATTGLLILIVAVATLLLVRKNLVELRASRLELKKLNEDLEGLVDARTAELQRANAEIQRFAYIVSHDLRSPLVNVMGFTAELDAARKAIATYVHGGEANGWHAPDAGTRAAIDEDLPEAIGFIRSSTQKMDRLINAILTLSRQGRRTLAPETLDLTAMAETIVGSLQHRIHEGGTNVTVAPLPTVIHDRLAVEQILSNLIENAVKYLKPGRPGIIAITGATEPGRVIISVSDNGRGIDPRDHERVFDLFRRSGPQDQPGEGIGLANARALAYRLGGFIEVQSALDEGSTFRFILPKEWVGGEAND